MIRNQRNSFIDKSLELSRKKLCKLEAISSCCSRFPAENGEWILVLTTLRCVPHYILIEFEDFDKYPNNLDDPTARFNEEMGTLLLMGIQRYTSDIQKKHYSYQVSSSINTSCFCRKFDSTLFETDDGKNISMAASRIDKNVFFRTSSEILTHEHLMEDYNVQKVESSYRFDQILLGDQFQLDGH